MSFLCTKWPLVLVNGTRVRRDRNKREKPRFEIEAGAISHEQSNIKLSERYGRQKTSASLKSVVIGGTSLRIGASVRSRTRGASAAWQQFNTSHVITVPKIH